jgi:hypothetical protein
MTTESPLYIVSDVTGIAQGARRPDPQPNTPHRDCLAGMAHLKLVCGNVALDRISWYRAHQYQLQVSIDEPPGLEEFEWRLHDAVERRELSHAGGLMSTAKAELTAPSCVG